MKKNILKKFIVLFSLSFILFGFNSVVASDEVKLGSSIFEVSNVSSALDVSIESSVASAPIEDTGSNTVVNLTVRDRDIIFSRTINLPKEGTVNLVDNKGVLRTINAQSVLSILKNAGEVSGSGFSISNLNYYEPFNPLFDPSGSLYLKCITDSIGEECDNWQYTVDNSYPYVSMDKKVLTSDKKVYNVYVYFGPQNKFVLNSNSITTADTLIVTSQKYDYQNNTWVTRTGINIGLTQPDISNPWTPTEIQTSEVNSNGQATFGSILEGSYNVGIKEDGYWPTENLVVIKFVPDSNGGSSGGGSGGNNQKTFSIENSLSFLFSKQKEDGSFGTPLFTDWVAIGVGQAGTSADSLKNKNSEYLKNNPVESKVITDYERRAMALMALGINPYDGTSVNYIKKITDSFDGTQIGDDSLYNDDIFGLIVLSHAGYSKKDEIIPSVVSYIIFNQSSDGSWGSVDMTAAALQALSNFKSLSGVNDSITKGELYLKSEQQNDGGFGNPSSTSWAIQSLSLNTSYNSEVDKAIKYLTEQQQADGGLDQNGDINNRIWITSYAIPAALKLSWNGILESFEKEEVLVANSTPQEEIDATLQVKQVPLIPEVISYVNKEVVAENKEIKIIQIKAIKKEKIIQAKINPKLTIKEEASNNLLVASAAESNQNPNNVFFSMIHKALLKISAPFIWFWTHLFS